MYMLLPCMFATHLVLLSGSNPWRSAFMPVAASCHAWLLDDGQAHLA
jgi:hypothetical protein